MIEPSCSVGRAIDLCHRRVGSLKLIGVTVLCNSATLYLPIIIGTGTTQKTGNGPDMNEKMLTRT